MRNTLVSITLLLLLGIGFTACKKDQTYDDRLSATWTSNTVLVNGADFSSFYDLTLTLKSNKDFTLALALLNPSTGTSSTTTSAGIWEASETDATLTLTYDGSSKIEIYDIQELSDNALKIEVVNASNDRITFSMTKQ
ncbi:MAG: hypothetical protein IPL65_04165 [Lewinellaceae bacterium]|nr:hypothetical protein [Lewinellaceae bacterium]